MISTEGEKGGKTCRKCVYVKGLLKFQMGWPARKGLAEKVTCEQRPGRSEELALLGSGEKCSGTGNSNCKGQKQDLWFAQHCPMLEVKWETGPSHMFSYSS